MRSFNRIIAAAAICTLATACNNHPLKKAELISNQEDTDTVAVAINKDVDILFVIDNSGSMAEEQATLARNFGSFIEVLEDDDVDANYRIAITTTDDGHGWLCSAGNAEAGRFRLSSCQSRSEEFEFNNENQFDLACDASCALDNIAITPTSTHLDPEPRPRPWLERIEGETNLPDGVSTVEAFQCFGPQGINGCGYEAHLSSMQKALIRASDERENEHGFLRPGAILAIIFVTDEADCSARNDSQFREVWDHMGPQRLWSETNKDNSYPTSEVCWRAGVTCTGGPGTFDDCFTDNIGVDGNPTSEEDAILNPVSKYVDFLRGIEDAKRDLDDSQRIIVGVIGGVPPGYAKGEADIAYQDSTASDNDFQLQHGIGPGCDTEAGQAAPPVRMLEFAENFFIDRRNLYSVCKNDYTDAMRGIADAIADRVRPPCVQVCVQDTDPTTLPLEANCRVNETFEGPDGRLQDRTIPACILTADSFELPAGADACFRALGDRDGLTPNPFDDMGEECQAQGWNLELALETRSGEPFPASSGVTATCLASTQPEHQCPDLGVPQAQQE